VSGSRSGDAAALHDQRPTSLPSNLRELHRKYDIRGTQNSAPSARARMPLPESVRVGRIVDLMLAVLSSAEFDHYVIFKLFESFPEVRLVWFWTLEVGVAWTEVGVVWY
jgi:hypothetical protein